MSMRAVILCLLLSVATPVGLGAAAQSPFARLQPGSLYAGETRQSGLRQQAELCLLDDGYFVLRQSFRKGDKDFTRHMTGLWLQTDDGALLQLDNSHGLALRCNVGGERNLYCPLPGIGGQGVQTVLLREGAFVMPEFSVMGMLERQGESFTLTDSASGRVFQLQKSAELVDIPDTPLFVDALVRPGSTGCTLLRLRSSSRSVPQEQAADFTADAARHVWLMPAGDEAATCIFTPEDDRHGFVTLSAPGLYLRLPYTVDGSALALTVQAADMDMLQGLGARELLHLQAVKRWRLSGPDLVLHTADGRQFMLKRADSEPRIWRIRP